MRIAIDYTSALRQAAGIGRYTRGLVRALASADSENEYTLLAPSDAHIDPASAVDSGRFRLKVLPASEHTLVLLWQRIQAPLYADWLAGGVDLFHSPDFTLPPLRRSPGVLTVHDLTFMRYPECAPPQLVNYLNASVPRSIRRAALILADSESTRRDLVELLAVPLERIVVVYAGVGPEFQVVPDSAQRAAICAKYGLTAPFLLTIGTLQPRKNHLRLVQAFAGVAGAFPDLKLVIAGGAGWLYDAIHEEIGRLGLERRIVFPGFVADCDVPSILSAAEVFVFPSLYEGFGLPVLEAMACGTPVVSSNASSMPEVAGDAAILVDPFDIEALADGIGRALTDSNLRTDLMRRGQEQAARFTWATAAQALLAAYRSVLQRD